MILTASLKMKFWIKWNKTCFQYLCLRSTMGTILVSPLNSGAGEGFSSSSSSAPIVPPVWYLMFLYFFLQIYIFLICNFNICNFDLYIFDICIHHICISGVRSLFLLQFWVFSYASSSTPHTRQRVSEWVGRVSDCNLLAKLGACFFFY